jgi:hypothetical protein
VLAEEIGALGRQNDVARLAAFRLKFKKIPQPRSHFVIGGRLAAVS